jgi:XRE family transcriptional regulator, master regulator for biofilm formation
VIGKTIYEFRKQRGLTLTELAKRANLSKSYLSNIERNLNQNPSIEVVKRIATVLDVELDIFLRPLNMNEVHQEKDQDLIDIAAQLKETGIQINEYKTLIEFIKWKNLKTKVEEN